MDKAFWEAQLKDCPALRPWLERAARAAVRRAAMPASLTLGASPCDRAIRRALEALFGPVREVNGRLQVRIADQWRPREFWLPLAEVLGIQPPAAADPDTRSNPARTLQRLKLLHPGEVPFIERLRDDPSLRRFLAASIQSETELLRLFEALLALESGPGGITLSELGARVFNDSKALRAGRLRKALERLLRLRLDALDSPQRDVLAEAGIIDNPLTALAAVFVPFAYQGEDGTWLDWPEQLRARGEAALIAWQTIRGMRTVRLPSVPLMVTTSENAAPFLRLVEQGTPALYTAGYPNAAVKKLLKLFGRAGATARHWGDTDPDGYRIADQVARCLPTELLPDPETAPSDRLRPLDHAQQQRAKRFLAAHPDFRYRNALERTLRDGWLEQEQLDPPEG